MSGVSEREGASGIMMLFQAPSSAGWPWKNDKTTSPTSQPLKRSELDFSGFYLIENALRRIEFDYIERN